MRRVIMLLFAAAASVAVLRANVSGIPPKRWSSDQEVLRLLLALDLADFPIKQKDLDRLLPIPPKMLYSGGASARSPAGSEATIYALTDPGVAAGFYALRTVLKIPVGGLTTTTSLPDLEITSAELVFVRAPYIWLSVSAMSPHRSSIAKMRSEMKAAKLTPKTYVEYLPLEHSMSLAQFGRPEEENSFRFEARQ